VLEWRFAVQGLTEFLTGYVLYRERGERACYEYWLKGTYTPCQISFLNYVRIYGALSRVLVPLRAFASIYFHDEGIDWRQRYEDFLHRYRLPKLFRGWVSSFEFEDMVIEHLRREHGVGLAKEFEELVKEDPWVVLDYSKMKR